MLGLSSADANDSFNTIDYALYADSGVGNKLVPNNYHYIYAYLII
jgi:hypothetical protein